MHVDTMRRVDFLAGVPLCFFLTGVLRLIGALSSARSVPPRRVLFIELSEMGSAVLVDPAMRKIQGLGATVFFVIFARNLGSLQLLNTVPPGNVFTIREDSMWTLTVDTLRFLRWVRRQGIDTVIDLELFSRYTALLTGLSGAANRIGFHRFHGEGLYRGEMLSRKVLYNPHLHIAKNFVALVNAALATSPELPCSKTVISDREVAVAKASVTDAERESVRALVREAFEAYDPDRHRLFLVNPNASDMLPQRRWMPEHFLQVIASILAEYADVLVLITGAPEEWREAEELRRGAGSERCINFAGRVRLQELPALYSIATLMLSNDSGPGHFSSVTDLQTFILYGPETPALYGSLGNSTPIYAGLACSPCVSAANHRKSPCRDNVCLRVITPEQVLVQLRTALGTEDGAVDADRSRLGSAGAR